MSRKKSVLCILIALIVGIAVGVVATLGVTGGNNNGTIVTPTITPTVIASGSCGTNMTWQLSSILPNDTSITVLEISGTGNMTSHPWNTDEYRDTILAVVMTDGIESIAANAFENCTHLTGVYMSNTITSIRHYAFKGCTSLTSLWIPRTADAQGIYSCIEGSGVTRVLFEGDKGMKPEIDSLVNHDINVLYNQSRGSGF